MSGETIGIALAGMAIALTTWGLFLQWPRYRSLGARNSVRLWIPLSVILLLICLGGIMLLDWNPLLFPVAWTPAGLALLAPDAVVSLTGGPEPTSQLLEMYREALEALGDPTESEAAAREVRRVMDRMRQVATPETQEFVDLAVEQLDCIIRKVPPSQRDPRRRDRLSELVAEMRR